MATRVSSNTVVLPFETASGATSSLSAGASNRALFGMVGWTNTFGTPPTINAFKQGGSGGTDITPATADELIYFGSGIVRVGAAAPGPASASDVYSAASSEGKQGGIIGATYEGVGSVADYTYAEGVQGDLLQVIAEITIPNMSLGSKATLGLIAISSSLTIEPFTTVSGYPATITHQSSDPDVKLLAAAHIEIEATSAGSMTTRIACNHATGQPVDNRGAIAWAFAGYRLVDAGGGVTYVFNPLSGRGGTVGRILAE